jgi:site-specific DNA-methyltransferase (adenine-specific)
VAKKTAAINDLVFEKKKLADITPASYNPRSISKDALAGLTSSISRFGLVEPIVWNKRTGNIVGGHQRFKVLSAQGVEETTVVVIDMPENEEVALNITLNNPAIQGDWTDGVGDLLKQVSETLPDLFGSVKLDDLEKALGHKEKNNAKTDPDEAPPVPEVSVSVEGEVYQLGDHRLICGSATNPEHMKKLLGEEKIDLWLVDPPYNVDYVGKTKDALKIDNDHMDDDHFLEFLVDSYQTANDVMKDGAGFYIWHADSEGYNFRLAARKVGWKVRQCLIWNKNCMVMGRQDYQWKHEPCLYGWKEGAGHCWNGGRTLTTVIDVNKPARNGEHPTMKPVELFSKQIENSSNEGDIVLDSFSGSGTTIIASELTKRRGRGVELSPKYCDVIRRRWAEMVHGESCDWKALTPSVETSSGSE